MSPEPLPESAPPIPSSEMDRLRLSPDSLDVHRLVRKLLRRPEPVRRPVERTFFYRLAKFAMRRAIPVLLVGAAAADRARFAVFSGQVGHARRPRITGVELGAPGR